MTNIVIKDRSRMPATSKMELFLTIVYSWKKRTSCKNSILDTSSTFVTFPFFQRSVKSHEDGGRKTMNRSPLVWNESYEIIVLPKIEIQRWFYTLRSSFFYAQKVFSQIWKMTVMLLSFETTLYGGEATNEKRF